MKGVPAGSLRAVLSLVLVVPLVTSFDPFPNTVYPFIVPKAAVSRILIEIAFGLWCFLAWRDTALRPHGWSWALAALGLYVAVGLLTSLAGDAPVRSLWSGYERMTGWVHTAHFAAWVLMLASVFRTWRQWLGLFRFAGVVALAVGLVAFLAQGSRLEWLAPYWPESGRALVTFGNPTYAGGFAVVAFFLCLGLAAPSAARLAGRTPAGVGGSAGPLLWWLVAGGLMLMLLWWSGTRGTLVALGGGWAALGLGCVLWPPGRWWRAGGVLILVGVIAAGVGAGFLVLSGSGAGEALQSGLRQHRPDSVDTRRSLAGIAWQGFLERPILGRGGENFGLVYGRHAVSAADPEPGAAGNFDRAHSAPLEELTGGGAAGLLAWTAVWFAILWAVVRGARRSRGAVRLVTLCFGAALAAHFA